MFTIKQAARRCGVPESSLRAWERRYAVVSPRRTDAGYRLYNEDDLARLGRMRELVEQGWSPAAAAEALRGSAPPAQHASPAPLALAEGASLTAELLDAAAAVDARAIETVLDRAFARGPFEAVADTWLMPTLAALGDAWEEGIIDVAGEHTASHAVMRKLSHTFAAAATTASGPRVVVGLPAGSHHELGALAFATTVRRQGLAVVYVGADLPTTGWQRAVKAFPTRAAVVAVPTHGDRESARDTAAALLRSAPTMLVATGGAHGEAVAPGALSLPRSLGEAARALAHS